MKTWFLIGIPVLLLGCVKSEISAPNNGPVISFYKGIDPWTNQPTFIYSDTTILISKSFIAKVNFAASATLRHVLVKQANTVLFDKELENDNYYNQEFQWVINPDKTKGTFQYTCEALDWEGKKASKTLTVIYP